MDLQFQCLVDMAQAIAARNGGYAKYVLIIADATFKVGVFAEVWEYYPQDRKYHLEGTFQCTCDGERCEPNDWVMVTVNGSPLVCHILADMGDCPHHPRPLVN